MAMNTASGNGNGNSNEPEVMMEINTTPLIDVMLVLLIMLIITIPAQLHSVNLDMPTSAAPAPPLEPLVVRIDIDGQSVVRWDGAVMENRADLEARLSDASQRVPQPELHIRADARAKYEAVAAVMANAQRLGLNKLGIVGFEQFLK